MQLIPTYGACLLISRRPQDEIADAMTWPCIALAFGEACPRYPPIRLIASECCTDDNLLTVAANLISATMQMGKVYYKLLYKRR